MTTLVTNIASRSGGLFDACMASEYLLRVYFSTLSDLGSGALSDIHCERLPDETEGDCAWEALTMPTMSPVSVPPSIVTNGNLARIFFSSGEKIQYIECSDVSIDGTPSFGNPVDVATVSGVLFLAAVSTDKVYYITQTSQNNRRMHVAEESPPGSWTATSSDVYWPFPIYAFDAEALSEYDVLMMASELSPLIGSRAVGTEVTTEAEAVQGIVTFRVANGRWSDHDVIDTIDQVEEFPSRGSLRLSQANDILFASYTRCGGKGDYTYTKLAIARSKDGINWEFPELLDTITAPAVVLPRDDYLYVAGVSCTMRSPCCAWAGQTPVSTDITDYVTGIESQAAEIRTTRTVLSNPGNVLDGTLAVPDSRVQIVHDLGYVIDGAGTRVTVSTEDVTAYGNNRQLPRRGVSLRSQDVLSRINRVVSDYATEWPGQQAGRDAYNDPTGTGYGGMTHTAPYTGSWEASGGICKLTSRCMQGLAVSTFVTDALNGSIRAGFLLHETDKGEYVGVALRIFDKDNFTYVAYFADDDTISLRQVIGGDETTLATSGAMSWTIDGSTWYYIMARVHYGMVYVYTSTDGVTWSAVSWDTGSAETPGMVGFDNANLQVWSGKFGLIGYAYAESAASPPDWTPSPWPEPKYPEGESGVLMLSEDKVACSENFFDLGEDARWEDITGSITGTIYHIDLGDRNQAFLTSEDGLWYCPNVRATSPTWVCIKTATAAESEVGHSGKFKGVGVTPGGTVYAPWHMSSLGGIQSGYYSGGAGALSFTWFPQPGGWDFASSPGRSSWCVYAKNGIYIGCGTGGGDGAGLYYGNAIERYDLWGYVPAVWDGYFSDWGGNVYPIGGGDAVYEDTECERFGAEMLGGHMLYMKGNGRYLYLDDTLIADALSVLGHETAARATFWNNKLDHIVWLRRYSASAGDTVVACTDDRFINFFDRTGNYFTAVGTWEGANGTSGENGNAMCILYPKRGITIG